MLVNQVYDTKAIALIREQNASNQEAYIGEQLFPNAEKYGLDLKWFVTHDKLPLVLAPSVFDTIPALRSRDKVDVKNTKMAFFREEMDVDEETSIMLDGLNDVADPRVKEAVLSLYDDANTLIEGARASAELMRMQLLATTNGHPTINIEADGVKYSYDYDPNGTYAAKHYAKLGTAWHATGAKPLSDIINVKKKMRAMGKTIKFALMTSTTFEALASSDEVKNAVILAGSVIGNISTALTDEEVKNVVKNKTGVSIIIYDKMYEDRVNGETSFFPDYKVAFFTEGTLGKTYHGTTPEARSAKAMPDADISKIAYATVTTITKYGPPVVTKTVVSDVMLPSYENMDNTFVIEMDAPQQ